MDLTPVTGAVRGAAGRAPHGAAAGASDGDSFLAALAALSSLVATIDGESGEATTPVDDSALPTDEATAEGNGAQAAIDAALAMLPVPIATTVAAPALPPAAPEVGASPAGGQTAAPQVPNGASALPVAPLAASAAPSTSAVSSEAEAPAAQKTAGETLVDTFTRTTPGGEVVQPESDPARTAVASNAAAALSAMQRLRVSERLTEMLDRGDEAKTAQVVPALPVVTRVGAPDAPTTTLPTPAAQVMSAFIQGLSTTSGNGSTSEKGDTGRGSAFGGHAAPASAGVAHGPSLTPAFAALVPSVPTSETLPPDTTTQIVQAIRMQMMRDGGEAHIRLDPRQFGDMTVRIRVDQGQVTARVEAEAPVVREWLQSNQHVLRQSLAGQQLTLDRLEVHEPPAPSDDQRRDGQSARDQERPQQRGGRRRRTDTGELFEVVA